MPDERTSPGRLIAGIFGVLIGAGCLTLFLQGVFASPEAASPWVSRTLWQDVVNSLGADSKPLMNGTSTAIPFVPVFVRCLALIASVWFAGGLFAAWRSKRPLGQVLGTYGLIVAGCLLLLVVVDGVRIFFPGQVGAWIQATSHLWFSLSTALVLTIPVWLATKPRNEISETDGARTAWFLLLSGITVSVATFTWMNWSLYWNLLLPHGDSAMYEEHIWNLTHGKGFRSYLDQGRPFLGEHVQVVHLLLTPLHMLWPSQLLLELCESLALGITAIPIFLIARRHSATPVPSALVAIAWLLYFPMHYLDIALDFKTFRPMCFGIPAMLFGIDQWERKRFKTAWLLFVLALSAKEDFALVLAPLVLYFGVTATEKRERLSGLGGSAAITAYLVLVVLVILPWFRGGAPAHFSQYFGELGASPMEIVKTSLRDPGLVLSKLLGMRSVLYTILLLLPCGFLPLLSLKRTLVAVPVLGMLYLLELSPDKTAQGEVRQQVLIPFHHFHATVLPILWWAGAAGLGRFRAAGQTRKLATATAFACCTAFVTCWFYSMSPLGIGFHDAGSRKHWKSLYVANERAEQVTKVLDAIPEDARVASTDFVHTRLTHRERSYDYSNYVNRTTVPDDADYIVIDAKHPWDGYSMASNLSEVRELKNGNDEWVPLQLNTEGYFIVLKRNRAQAK